MKLFIASIGAFSLFIIWHASESVIGQIKALFFIICFLIGVFIGIYLLIKNGKYAGIPFKGIYYFVFPLILLFCFSILSARYYDKAVDHYYDLAAASNQNFTINSLPQDTVIIIIPSEYINAVPRLVEEYSISFLYGSVSRTLDENYHVILWRPEFGGLVQYCENTVISGGWGCENIEFIPNTEKE